MTRVALLLAGIAPLTFAVPAAAQSMNHSMHGAAPAPTPVPSPTPAPAPVAQPAPEAPAEGSMEQMDHGNMQGMDMEPEASSCPPEHAAMGHCTPEAEAPDKGASDMGAMDHGAPQPSDPDCPPEHAKMGHCTPKGGYADPVAGMEGMATTTSASGTDLPPGDATAPAPPGDWYADRIYPKAEMEHSRHDMMKENGAQTIAFISFNLAEFQARKGRDGFRWDGEAWYGGDINRLTIKSEGEGVFGEGIEGAEVQALYSRAIGPYFNAQAGIRQDLGLGPDRTYATIGFEGLAPYWFEVEGALFLSNKGDLLARLEGYYDQRITQKLILQPMAEVNFALQDVPETGVGSGLSDFELGLRLRYEVVKEFAPYVGVEWAGKVGDTARFARAAGEDASGVSFVMGVRAWF
ncbi:MULTISPECIES: copper resistance protein B [unclassified Sphingopyxis]|jgi:copper resistance protein B|uniref:copper resistance protein B n=1 Tax=unclassified Sphingopyxis TaxID=2614943 RepID=UPI000BA68FA6|nr:MULTISPECIES: copper resistance protein B [unclassified Sphingopyxis]PAL19737.1 copper resistance protein CopB [Sphingopyxis sp. GW247-27LB]HET6525480.1 copper resistance protein B [Sphingopyxis sp.]HMO73756.1 copper resistance protein B [Sphingopyxis sp.]HMP43588.1 copper resistance protein B [Sphingopyxis sp.]